MVRILYEWWEKLNTRSMSIKAARVENGVTKTMTAIVNSGMVLNSFIPLPPPKKFGYPSGINDGFPEA